MPSVLTVMLAPSPLPAQAKVELKAVSYKELGQVVKQHKGKVVLVDFWASW